MKRRLNVKELMRREDLRGEVLQLFHSQRTGMIHGDNGYDVTFNAESLVVGLGYGELGIGLRVSYGIFFATRAKLPTAINVRPVSSRGGESTDSSENAVSATAARSRVA